MSIINEALKELRNLKEDIDDDEYEELEQYALNKHCDGFEKIYNELGSIEEVKKVIDETYECLSRYFDIEKTRFTFEPEYFKVYVDDKFEGNYYISYDREMKVNRLYNWEDDEGFDEDEVKETVIKDIDEFIKLVKESKEELLVASEFGDLYHIGNSEDSELNYFLDEYNDDVGEIDFHICKYNPEKQNIDECIHFYTKDDDEVKKILRELCGYKSIWDTLLEKFGNKNNKYLLVAEQYDRGPAPTYKRKFNAPNDYIALFSMYCHDEPTEEELVDYFGDDFSDYPQTYEEMLKYARSTWWGDGDDYIILLENITEDKTLYEGD